MMFEAGPKVVSEDLRSEPIGVAAHTRDSPIAPRSTGREEPSKLEKGT